MKRLMIASMALLLAAQASAQEANFNRAEVIVTGQRVEYDGYSNDMPAVGLWRTADFLVQRVAIKGDTRDEAPRRQEIRAMLAQAVQLAAQSGVELAYGEDIVSPLTAANVGELNLQRDTRPDSEQVSFLIKAPLGGKETGQAAQDRIARYIKSVPEVGRAQLDEVGDVTLSVVGPDSFRPQIAAKIAEDARAMTAQIGADYAVEIEGLNMPVQWVRSGPAEIMLYIPYKLRIVPKP